MTYSPDELSNIWADLRGEGLTKCDGCGEWYEDDSVCPECEPSAAEDDAVRRGL